jgi:peroxiredoxin Q/BCP
MSGFRDIAAKFADANAQVLGISTDDIETQKKFADSLKLPFPLLADKDGSVAKAYGVLLEGYADRVTFVIDSDGKIEKVLSGKDALDPAPALASCPLHKKK